jgi:chromate transport protein ChrA
MTIIFPIISILYLIAENGGPGYLQSLFCGIPVTLLSIIAGGVALVQIRRVNQKGNWMAILGIVFGILFFVIFYVMVVILIAPYLFGGAQ